MVINMKSKKRICVVVVTMCAVYLFLCLLASLLYPFLRDRLIPTSNLIYSSDLKSKNGSINDLIIYLDGDNIVYRKVGNIAITPFGIVSIPVIESEYIYNTKSPEKSMYRERFKTENIREYVSSSDIFVAKDILSREVIDNPPNVDYMFYSAYMGYSTDMAPLKNVRQFELNYEYKGGRIFLFFDFQNENFNEDSLDSLIMLSLD